MPRTRQLKITPLDALEHAAECLRTLAHPHRLRMVQLLLQQRFTVSELAAACEIPQHMASEHLGKMKDRGLLTSTREGRKIYYSVAEEGLKGIMNCVEGRFGVGEATRDDVLGLAVAAQEK